MPLRHVQWTQPLLERLNGLPCIQAGSCYTQRRQTDTETGVGVAIQTLLREPRFTGLMVPGG